MANSNNIKEPNTAPPPDRWFNLTLGSSFKDDHSSSKFCSLRYEFKPASIDKSQPGSLHKNKDNRVTVEFQNNQHGKPKVSFEGSSEDYKDNDAVLLFDGETFRLERLHRAVKRLRHVRLPGESAAAAAAPSVGMAAESSPPPLGKAPKFHQMNKNVPQSMPVEMERIELGDFKSSDPRTKIDKVVDCPPAHPNHIPRSPDLKHDDVEEEQLDILNDDDDNCAADIIRENAVEKQVRAAIDINLPHDTDDEIADIDGSGDEADKDGHNGGEIAGAQANPEGGREEQTSSSSHSGSDSSGSGSGSGSSSSDSSSSDGDSINSI